MHLDERRGEVLDRMGVPSTYRKARLDRIPNTCPHKETVSEYVADIKKNILAPRGLYLFGPYSSGKSGLGAICLEAGAAAGFVGLWVNATKYPGQVIEDEMFDEEWTVQARAEAVPLLVIDRLEIREEIRYREQEIDTLVRVRTDKRLATIITSVLPLEAVERFPSLYAVLPEHFTPVKVHGFNFRKNEQ